MLRTSLPDCFLLDVEKSTRFAVAGEMYGSGTETGKRILFTEAGLTAGALRWPEGRRLINLITPCGAACCPIMIMQTKILTEAYDVHCHQKQNIIKSDTLNYDIFPSADRSESR